MKAISDVHLSPGEEYQGERVDVLVGDTFNILPYGMARWRAPEGRATVASLTRCLDSQAVFVCGNHEGRLSWLQELVPDFKVVRYLDVDDKRFIHGHQFAGDWSILRRFAPDLVEWFTSNPVTRKLFWNFCRRQGWMAGGAQGNARYEPFVASVWAWALKAANENKRHYVIGHSHQRAGIYPEGFYSVIDLGANQVLEV